MVEVRKRSESEADMTVTVTVEELWDVDEQVQMSGVFSSVLI